MILRRAALSSALLLALAGCAHQSRPLASEEAPRRPAAAASAPAEQELTAEERSLSAEQRARLYYHILLAELAEARGEQSLAETNFSHAAKASGRAELARRAAVAAQRSGNAAAIETSTALWARLSPQEIDAQALLTVNHFKRGETEAAAAGLRRVRELVRAANARLLRELMRIAESAALPATLEGFTALAEESDEADVRLVTAHLALRLKNWTEAEHQAKALLDKEPAQLDALRLLVLSLDAQKRRPEALAALRASLKAGEVSAERVQTLGTLFLHLEDGPAARRLYQEHLQQHPNARDIHYALAGLLFDDKDYAAARPHFEQVLALAPDSPAAHYYLGQIAEREERTADALTHYAQVDGGRFQYDARLQAARLVARQGELGAARELLKVQAQQTPDRRLDLLVAELDLLRDASELAEARRLLAESLKEFPGNVQLLLAQAQIASVEEDFDLTRLALEQALVQVDNPELRKQLILAGSEVLRGGGQSDAALALISRGLTQAPDDIELLYARAILAESLGQSSRSEADLRAILSREPDNATALNALGYALVDRNQRLGEAGQLLERALSLSPDDPAVIDSMGWLHYRRGELPRALEFLRRAYTLNADPEIAAHLGEVLWQSGARAEARDIWDAALDKAPEHRVLKQVMERFKP